VIDAEVRRAGRDLVVVRRVVVLLGAAGQLPQLGHDVTGHGRQRGHRAGHQPPHPGPVQAEQRAEPAGDVHPGQGSRPERTR
jgi:hypothetical protein